MGLISDLLDLSRLDEDRLKPDMKEVDCMRVIRSAMRQVTPAAEAKRVKVETVAPASVPPCRTDSNRLEQILVNLLTNAADAVLQAGADGGGKIRIDGRISEGSGALEIAVRDDGVGIGPDDVARIFEPFYTTKGRGKGTGLGLAICRELAQALGGRISVESAPGRGSTFMLRLPRTDAAQKAS